MKTSERSSNPNDLPWIAQAKVSGKIMFSKRKEELDKFHKEVRDGCRSAADNQAASFSDNQPDGTESRLSSRCSSLSIKINSEYTFSSSQLSSSIFTDGENDSSPFQDTRDYVGEFFYQCDALKG